MQVTYTRQLDANKYGGANTSESQTLDNVYKTDDDDGVSIAYACDQATGRETSRYPATTRQTEYIFSMKEASHHDFLRGVGVDADLTRFDCHEQGPPREVALGKVTMRKTG